MKKRLVSMIVCLVLVPGKVLANSGIPVIDEYEALVSNKDGAFIYDWKGKLTEKIIEYNKKIYIYDEYQLSDGYYGNFGCLEDNCDTHGLVKLSDIIKINEEYSLNKAQKLEKENEVMVSDKNGAVLYKGPSFGYQVVSEAIPYKTVLKYQYKDGVWVYTSYNGKE